jgi:hypothetical protein
MALRKTMPIGELRDLNKASQDKAAQRGGNTAEPKDPKKS